MKHCWPANDMTKTLCVQVNRGVVLKTAVLVSRALETNFMQSWSWSWYLWSWSRSWRVGLEKFQDQLCTAPVHSTVQSYLELASLSPNATVKNILCNEQIQVTKFVSSMYCVPARAVPMERIFSHGDIIVYPHRHTWLMMYCATWCLQNAMLLC